MCNKCNNFLEKHSFSKGFDIRNVNLKDLNADFPKLKSKGIYLISILKRGENADLVYDKLKIIIDQLKWNMVEIFMNDRVKRICKINDCSIIYIGAAGGQHKDSKNNLIGRYFGFKDSHTIMMPLWALIYFGWELNYHFIAIDNPQILEEKLLQGFKEVHAGALPALNKKDIKLQSPKLN